MEFACGGDLAAYLSRTPTADEPLAKRLFIDVMSGIEFIHSKGIAHRDLKPENVLLTDEDPLLATAKLTDFGLSRRVPASKIKSWAGTYMSPEMLKETGHDLKTDIWSAGVIFAYLLTGLHPFDDKDDARCEANFLLGVDFSKPQWVTVSE